MIVTLLQHQWKAFWRSRNTGKSVAIQIFVGFLFLYFLMVALFVGFWLNKILLEIYPNQSVITSFNSWILYFFSVDLLVRFLMQELPTLSIQPYLAHNIRRKQIVQFLNIKSLFTFINLIPFVLFLPFTFQVILPKVGGLQTLGYIISLLSLTIVNHFAVMLIKRKSVVNSWWLVGFFITIAVFGALDYWKIVSVLKFSAAIFQTIMQLPWLCILFIAYAVATFITNQRFLLSSLYIDGAENNKKSGVVKADYAWLNQFGTVGELISIDLKLILRNKRTRSLLFLSFIILFYGFMFYKKEFIDKDEIGMLLMGGIFMTGMFTANFGQFIFSWQSAHFDGFLSGRLPIISYIKSKFYLLVGFSTLNFILTTAYGIISWKIIPVQLAAFFYNIGLHTVLCLFMGTYNDKSLDLGRNTTFNYQGTGVVQWLYIFVIALPALIIYLPFALIFNSWVGVIALGVTGLISFLLKDWWFVVLSKAFMQRKYRLLDGFRQK